MPTHDPTGALVGGIVAMYGALLVLALALSVFWIVELVDAARREFRDPNMKIVWLLVIVLSHFIGSLVYYFVGKPMGTLPGQGPPPARY